MSDGGVGNGLSYWANIRISGQLESADLKRLKSTIQKILSGKINGKPVKGIIDSEARASDNSIPTFNVGFSHAKKAKR